MKRTTAVTMGALCCALALSITGCTPTEAEDPPQQTQMAEQPQQQAPSPEAPDETEDSPEAEEQSPAT